MEGKKKTIPLAGWFKWDLVSIFQFSKGKGGESFEISGGGGEKGGEIIGQDEGRGGNRNSIPELENFYLSSTDNNFEEFINTLFEA